MAIEIAAKRVGKRSKCHVIGGRAAAATVVVRRCRVRMRAARHSTEWDPARRPMGPAVSDRV